MRVIVVLDWDSVCDGEAVGVIEVPEDCDTEEEIGILFAQWLRQKFPGNFKHKTNKGCWNSNYSWRDYEVETVKER